MTGGVDSSLRQEGLHLSHLMFWCKAEAHGELAISGASSHDRPSRDGTCLREWQFERELVHTRKQLQQTELIVAIKNVDVDGWLHRPGFYEL